METIILTEIKRAVFAAHSKKSPGLDEIPVLVWQQLWPICQEAIQAIFQTAFK